MRALLYGPPPRLPAPLDGLAAQWARVPPRARILVVVVVVLTLLVATELRVRRAASRWGGAPVAAWVAVSDTGVGEIPDLERRRLPPGALPVEPVTAGDAATPLTLALPAGAVLTEQHVCPAGPAVGLPAGTRLLPVPVDEGWAIAAGGRVDAWLVGRDGGTVRVARARPVLEVRSDESGDLTALVAVEESDVAELASGLADGAIVLSHAPG